MSGYGGAGYGDPGYGGAGGAGYGERPYPGRPEYGSEGHHGGLETGRYSAEGIHKGASHEQQQELFKVVCEANPSFYLTDRAGELVLSHGDERNPHQQWFKDASHSSKKDKEGFPAFALINKGSGLALYHDDKKDKVYLRPYDPKSEGFLWSRSADVGHGYQCIRPLTDVHLNLDANHGDKDHGGVKDGTNVILHKWNKQENQKWKILPITSTGSYASQGQGYGNYAGQSVKLSCEARTDYFVTVRGDHVVLAAGEENDPRQEWLKDERLAANMKDETGSPAFALVNKATHKALQHGMKEFDKVGLASGFGNQADESVMWTLSEDVGKGYRCIRTVRNIHLNLDASHGDEKHGGVKDGTELILYKWLKRENQKWMLTYV